MAVVLSLGVVPEHDAPAQVTHPSSWVADRAIVVVPAAALIASYLLTWELWHGRTSPPNLPAVGALAGRPFGIVLVAAALVATFRPRLGAVLHTGAFLLAVLGDQLRLQPEFASLAILLAACAWSPKGRQVARWYLVSLWGWAGIHKVLSAGWATGGAAFIADSVGAKSLRPTVAVLVPLVELGLAALALRPRMWPILRVAAPLFHLGIFATLALADWNSAVWPWNLAIAVVAPLLFRPGAAHAVDTPRRSSPLVAAIAVAFLVYPLGFYLGISDAYLSHNLYSSNTAAPSICRANPDRCIEAFSETWSELNVPIPPEPRLFAQWFKRTCQPDERLRIDGIDTRLSTRKTTYLPCPAGVT